MNKYIKNRIYRIATIIFCLKEGSWRSINELSELLGIDKYIIREDILSIASFPKKRSAVSAYEDEECYDDMINVYSSGKTDLGTEFNDMLSEIEKAKGLEKLRTVIHTGKYDDVGLCVNFFQSENNEDNYRIVMTKDEYTVLKDFLERHDYFKLGGPDGNFQVKNNYAVSKEEYNLIKKISDYIDSAEKISFNYKSKKNDIVSSCVIEATFIEHNADTGFIYIISSNNFKYRLDRIDKVSIKPTDSDITETSVCNAPDPIHIKVKIKKYKRNDIYPKIIHDLSGMNTGDSYDAANHIKSFDDYYIYEDDVYDKGKIKSWIYSYGSAMVVLEPEDLRKEIIESYMKRKDYYGGSNG